MMMSGGRRTSQGERERESGLRRIVWCRRIPEHGVFVRLAALRLFHLPYAAARLWLLAATGKRVCEAANGEGRFAQSTMIYGGPMGQLEMVRRPGTRGGEK